MPRQACQIARVMPGSGKFGRNRDKAKAGRAAFQPVEHFIDAFSRLAGQAGKRSSQLIAKRQQRRLTQQGRQFGNPLLVNILHTGTSR